MFCAFQGAFISPATPLENWASILRVWWAVSGMLVLLMQIGFIKLETGCIHKLDRPGIAIKNLTMLLTSTLVFGGVGFFLMYGDTHLGGLIGWGGQPASTTGIAFSYEWVFLQLGFAAVAATIVSGAMAGRTTLFSNVIVAFVMAGLLFPLFGHWVWGTGLLSDRVRDFAGSGTVHFLGGMVALLGAYIAGPRRGKAKEFNHPVAAAGVGVDPRTDSASNLIRLGSERDLKSTAVGVVFLWVGWIGFNGGSVNPKLLIESGGFGLIGQAVISTTLAACAGGLTVLFVAGLWAWKSEFGQGESLSGCFRMELLFDPFATLTGTMGGMVAITANCDWVQDWYVVAVAIGALGGLAAFLTMKLVRHIGVDDPVDAVAVHAGGGATGMLLASIPEGTALGDQVLALFLAAGLAFCVMGPVFRLLKARSFLRTSELREMAGLQFRPIDDSLAEEMRDGADSQLQERERLLWRTHSNAALFSLRPRFRLERVAPGGVVVAVPPIHDPGGGDLVNAGGRDLAALARFLDPPPVDGGASEPHASLLVVCSSDGLEDVNATIRRVALEEEPALILAPDAGHIRRELKTTSTRSQHVVVRNDHYWRSRLVNGICELQALRRPPVKARRGLMEVLGLGWRRHSEQPGDSRVSVALHSVGVSVLGAVLGALAARGVTGLGKEQSEVLAAEGSEMAGSQTVIGAGFILAGPGSAPGGHWVVDPKILGVKLEAHQSLTFDFDPARGNWWIRINACPRGSSDPAEGNGGSWYSRASFVTALRRLESQVDRAWNSWRPHQNIVMGGRYLVSTTDSSGNPRRVNDALVTGKECRGVLLDFVRGQELVFTLEPGRESGSSKAGRRLTVGDSPRLPIPLNFSVAETRPGGVVDRLPSDN